MKKILLSLVAIAAAVFATSCTNDLLDEGVKGNTVALTISTPELATRAFGDGAKATDLYYAIYESGRLLTEISKIDTPEKLVNGQKTVYLTLAQGLYYEMIFWAGSPEGFGTLYNVDFAAKTMTLQPAALTSQNENLDAFYTRLTGCTIENLEGTTVALERPFSQLNISVSNEDLEAARKANLVVGKTLVKVTTPTVLNLENGEAADATEVTYALANAANVAGYPKAGYHQLAMNYLLANASKSLVNVTFKYTREGSDTVINTREFGNVPVQRNYRTNIYGDILTKNIGFTVDLQESWTATHELDSDAIYVIDANGEFHKFTTLEEALADALSGETISLPAGEYTLPAGISIKDGTRADAKAITIKGVEDVVLNGAVGQGNNPGNYAYGLDLTFENLTYKTANSGYSGGFGHAAKVTFNNCTIIGQMYCHSGAPHFFNNCTIDPLNGYLYTYASDVVFNGCTFNASEGKALQVYEDGETGKNNVLIEDCTFKAAKVGYTWDNKPVTAIDINNNGASFNVVVNDCTAEGFGIGLNSGSNLWNIKGGHKTVTLTIDREVVWAAGTEFVANGVSKVNGEYYISNVNGLLWVEAQVDNFFAGKTIKLAADLDMNGVTIANPIKFWDGRTTFDGQNHTISNLTMSTKSTEKKPFSLFTGTADIKNLKFDKANISGYSYVAVVAGNLYGNIENCHVTNSNVTCTYWMAGAFSGQYNSGNVTNCSVENTTITGPAAVGALVGVINETAGERKIENNTVKNCEIKQNGSFGGDYDNMFGTAVGLINTENAVVYFTDNTIESTTVKGEDTASLFGAYETSNTIYINNDEFVAHGVTKAEGIYYISSAEGMFWFANEVNVNKNAFTGETVKLAADIDLENAAWAPVGQTGATTFNGVFDGQNHTISNLNVNSETQTGAHYSSGLFGWVESHTAGHGHLKNVKINDATINGHHNCGALVGYITQETALVENCHVTGATVTCTYANGDADGDKAGALIGNATVATPVKNCTAANSTVSAGRDAGQLIGAGKEANVTGCSATNVTVSANGTGTGANVRNEVIGRLL